MDESTTNNKPPLKWAIYYEDGTCFTNRDGEYRDAPSFGVLGVLCDKDEMVLGGDFTGLIDYLCRVGIVKFGRMTDNKTFESVMSNVNNLPHPELGFDRIVNQGNDYYWWMGELKHG